MTPEEITDHGAALAWFAAELPVLLNIVGATVELARPLADTYLCRTVRTMAHYLERRGHWLQWITAQHLALDAAKRLADPVEEAHALRSLGRARARLDRIDEAIACFLAAGALFEAAGDHAGHGRIGLDLSGAEVRRGNHPEALRHSREALEHFTLAGHRAGQGRAHNNIAWCLSWLGQCEDAVDHCRQALDLQEELDDRFGAADTWDTLGHAEHALRRYRQAAASYQRSYELWQELGHRYQEADLLTRLGETRRALGDRAAAADAWRRALDIFAELDHPDAKLVRAQLEQLDPDPTTG